MVIEFSVQNFRSIYDLQTISFAATNLNSSKDNIKIDENNIRVIENQRLLKTIGIYGANASGKSNIIKAFEYFCDAVFGFPSPESQLSSLTQPFLYQNDPNNTETFFQIVLIIDNKKYRYGFTVKKNTGVKTNENYSSEIITNEWLFGPKNTNQVKYFVRKGLDIDNSNFKESEGIAALQYEHTLYLTHIASYINGVAAKIRLIISSFVTTKSGMSFKPYNIYSISYVSENKLKNQFIDFFKSFGLHYKDIYIKDSDEFKRDNSPEIIDKVFLVKSGRDDSSKDILLNMQNNESDGTKKLFDIAGLILDAFNSQTSRLIIIDEIDSNFHPSLLIKLIELFNNPEINKSNAQLLFTSHDTNLMSPTLMRRDQFYLAEKEENESTKLYSLAELKGIRNDADFAKHYLAGFYGGLPILSQFSDENNI